MGARRQPPPVPAPCTPDAGLRDALLVKRQVHLGGLRIGPADTRAAHGFDFGERAEHQRIAPFFKQRFRNLRRRPRRTKRAVRVNGVVGVLMRGMKQHCDSRSGPLRMKVAPTFQPHAIEQQVKDTGNDHAPVSHQLHNTGTAKERFRHRVRPDLGPGEEVHGNLLNGVKDDELRTRLHLHEHAGDDLEEVENALTPKDVRPLTDKVLVGSPETVEYALAGKWFLSSSDSTLLASITKAVDAAVEGYRLWQRSKPGRDINPDELIARMRNAGAKRVELATPVFQRLTETQIARETSVAMTFGGVEDE